MNSPRTTSWAQAGRAVERGPGHAPRCPARAIATSAGKCTAGGRHHVVRPRIIPVRRGARSASARSATLAHLLHARLLLGEVLVEDRLLLGRQHRADLRITLVVERLHLLERFGAIAAALHRLANGLHLRLILRLDLGDLGLLGLGELDAVQAAVEPSTATTLPAL